jgi:hypothetical protein
MEMRASQISRTDLGRVASPLAGEDGPAKRETRGGVGSSSAISGIVSRRGRRAVLAGVREETI